MLVRSQARVNAVTAKSLQQPYHDGFASPKYRTRKEHPSSAVPARDRLLRQKMRK